jgi:hypothetical protein
MEKRTDPKSADLYSDHGKIRNTLVGHRFNSTERAILEAIDKRISWWRQILAVGAGFVFLRVLLGLARLTTRGPLFLLGSILGAGIIDIITVIYLYH